MPLLLFFSSSFFFFLCKLPFARMYRWHRVAYARKGYREPGLAADSPYDGAVFIDAPAPGGADARDRELSSNIDTAADLAEIGVARR